MQKTISSYIKDAILQRENKILKEDPQPTESAPVKEPQTREVLDNTENGEKTNKIIETPTNFLFESTAPYPEITGVEPSLFEVRQLKLLASSRKSEFSALNTYLYQYFILRKSFPQVADTLLKISTVEMEHYERLSNAIVDFGGNPNLTDGRGNVWTGRNVSQIRNVRDILVFNINAEKEAVKAYEDASNRTRNQSLKELYLRIAEDEKLHIKALEELSKSL